MSTQSSGRFPAIITLPLAAGIMLAAAETDSPPSEKPGWEWVSPHDKPIAVLRGHKQTVHSVAFSPDGSIIAVGSGDAKVRLWDVSARTAGAGKGEAP